MCLFLELFQGAVATSSIIPKLSVHVRESGDRHCVEAWLFNMINYLARLSSRELDYTSNRIHVALECVSGLPCNKLESDI
jgi:hypothetical protein